MRSVSGGKCGGELLQERRDANAVHHCSHLHAERKALATKKRIQVPAGVKEKRERCSVFKIPVNF